MKELGITKGERIGVVRKHPVIEGAELTDIKSVFTHPNGIRKSIGTIHATQKEEGKSNTKLVIDTFNTAQKTGLLPSELLGRYNEAIEVLEEVHKDGDNYLPRTTRIKVEQTILKSKR